MAQDRRQMADKCVMNSFILRCSESYLRLCEGHNQRFSGTWAALFAVELFPGSGDVGSIPGLDPPEHRGRTVLSSRAKEPPPSVLKTPPGVAADLAPRGFHPSGPFWSAEPNPLVDRFGRPGDQVARDQICPYTYFLFRGSAGFWGRAYPPLP